ncbi:MAG TPA: NAD-dependent protein deacylase [Candidatus Coprovivens excrementavium]|nr:NAD-dependent protein deacylase [Candidatus Coprovivens excrementavium]
MDDLLTLQKLIDNAQKIVFFGGAGVSTESGIKDFRSKDGLYNQKYDYPPEVYLSRSFFNEHPELFFKFYKDKLNCLNAEPNICHKYLVKLENEGKLKAIITQNIDGLHEKAGSKKVLLLHGTIYKNYCMKCHKSYEAKDIFEKEGIPRCSCGGIIKPDVVLYEENLDEDVVRKAIEAIEDCDLLIVAGTSLVVYPAASFINYYRGDQLVIINKDVTPYDRKANLVINDKLGNVFSKLK